MNYRHIYHAGNFADVAKHAVLALVIEHLKLKEAAFRVIDTHAGIGRYDLQAEAAQRTEEWRTGIGRLLGPDAPPIPPAVLPLLTPFLDVVRALNPSGLLEAYPGSPRLARALLRPQDRLVVNELHPDDATALRREFAGDPQVKVMEMDGWTALKALLPPAERRGVILVDPPFEERGDLDRLEAALRQGVRRFATGVFLLWYPIKDVALVGRFKQGLAESGIPRLLAAEITIRGNGDASVLSGSGLVIHNPPYRLETALRVLLPFLADRLARDGGGRWRLDELSSEAASPPSLR